MQQLQMPKCSYCKDNFTWGLSIYGKWVQLGSEGQPHICIGSTISTADIKIKDSYCEKCLFPLKSTVNSAMCRCLEPKLISKKKGLELLRKKVDEQELIIKKEIIKEKESEKMKECFMCGSVAIQLDNEYICLKDITHRVPII